MKYLGQAALRHAHLIEGLRAQACALKVSSDAIGRAERRAREGDVTLEVALRDEIRRKAYGDDRS